MEFKKSSIVLIGLLALGQSAFAFSHTDSTLGSCVESSSNPFNVPLTPIDRQLYNLDLDSALGPSGYHVNASLTRGGQQITYTVNPPITERVGAVPVWQKQLTPNGLRFSSSDGTEVVLSRPPRSPMDIDPGFVHPGLGEDDIVPYNAVVRYQNDSGQLITISMSCQINRVELARVSPSTRQPGSLLGRTVEDDPSGRYAPRPLPSGRDLVGDGAERQNNGSSRGLF